VVDGSERSREFRQRWAGYSCYYACFRDGDDHRFVLGKANVSCRCYSVCFYLFVEWIRMAAAVGRTTRSGPAMSIRRIKHQPAIAFAESDDATFNVSAPFTSDLFLS